MFVQGEKIKKISEGWMGGIGLTGIKEKEEATVSPVQPRKNFNETAFFFPDLHTDAEGNVEFSLPCPKRSRSGNG